MPAVNISKRHCADLSGPVCSWAYHRLAALALGAFCSSAVWIVLTVTAASVAGIALPISTIAAVALLLAALGWVALAMIVSDSR